MDNQNESSIAQLIEAVMWYIDDHVDNGIDIGIADNVNCALHGIVNKLGGTIEEPPNYKEMQERARSVKHIEPAPWADSKIEDE